MVDPVCLCVFPAGLQAVKESWCCPDEPGSAVAAAVVVVGGGGEFSEAHISH